MSSCVFQTAKYICFIQRFTKKLRALHDNMPEPVCAPSIKLSRPRIAGIVLCCSAFGSRTPTASSAEQNSGCTPRSPKAEDVAAEIPAADATSGRARRTNGALASLMLGTLRWTLFPTTLRSRPDHIPVQCAAEAAITPLLVWRVVRTLRGPIANSCNNVCVANLHTMCRESGVTFPQ